MSDNKNLSLKNQGFSVNLSNEIFEELANLNGGLERIKIPAGGGTTFEFPNLENAEDTISIKEFSAVILLHHPLSLYYKEKYNGTTVSPDCMSFDSVVGTTGELCRDCQHNRFGSGENGGKACKTKEQLYILREGDVFPMAMLLPTGSVKVFHTYVRRLLYRGKKSNGIVTKFSLKKTVNKTGIAYSQVNFTAERNLQKAEIEDIKNLIEKMKNFVQEAKSGGLQTSDNNSGN